MNGVSRRSFLKGMGTLIGICYTNPMALIPEIPPIGNHFISPHVAASEALALLEDNLIFTQIRPAMRKLAENIDRDIANQIIKETM